MQLTEETKELVRQALKSHKFCYHQAEGLCDFLIVSEVAFLRGEAVSEDEELREICHFIADCVLETLILKGMVEVTGIDAESGDFFIGLTLEGEEVVKPLLEQQETEGNG